MSAQLIFQKRTPEGLSVDLEEYDGMSILLLTKKVPGKVSRAAQVVGVALREVNTPTSAWYYEYDPIPKHVRWAALSEYLANRGYDVGVFDQFGNFVMKRAA